MTETQMSTANKQTSYNTHTYKRAQNNFLVLIANIIHHCKPAAKQQVGEILQTTITTKQEVDVGTKWVIGVVWSMHKQWDHLLSFLT